MDQRKCRLQVFRSGRSSHKRALPKADPWKGEGPLAGRTETKHTRFGAIEAAEHWSACSLRVSTVVTHRYRQVSAVARSCWSSSLEKHEANQMCRKSREVFFALPQPRQIEELPCNPQEVDGRELLAGPEFCGPRGARMELGCASSPALFGRENRAQVVNLRAELFASKEARGHAITHEICVSSAIKTSSRSEVFWVVVALWAATRAEWERHRKKRVHNWMGSSRTCRCESNATDTLGRRQIRQPSARAYRHPER